MAYERLPITTLNVSVDYRILPKNLKVGDLVVKASDWTWGGRHKGKHKVGRVLEIEKVIEDPQEYIHRHRLVRVKWSAGRTSWVNTKGLYLALPWYQAVYDYMHDMYQKIQKVQES